MTSTSPASAAHPTHAPAGVKKGDTRITLLASALDRAATGIARACEALARGERRQVSKTAILGELAVAIAGPGHDWGFLKNRPTGTDGVRRFVQPGLEETSASNASAGSGTTVPSASAVPSSVWVVEIDTTDGWAYPPALFLSRAAAIDFVRSNALWQKHATTLTAVLAALETRDRYVSESHGRGLRVELRHLPIHPGLEDAEAAARADLLEQARIEARADFLLASQGDDVGDAIEIAGLDADAVTRAIEIAAGRFVTLRRDFLLAHLGRDGRSLVEEMILHDGDWSILVEVIDEMAEAGEGNPAEDEGSVASVEASITRWQACVDQAFAQPTTAHGPLSLEPYRQRCLAAVAGFADSDAPDEPAAALMRVSEGFEAEARMERGTLAVAPSVAMGRARTAANLCWQADGMRRLAR